MKLFTLVSSALMQIAFYNLDWFSASACVAGFICSALYVAIFVKV